MPVICALLDAPREDWERFALWTDAVFKAFTFPFSADEVPDVLRAWSELEDYVDDMVARRRHTPTDDLLSDLIRAEHDGDRLNGGQLPHARRRAAAGRHGHHPQPSGRIDRDYFCEHPQQWKLERDNPDLAVPAVNETRCHSRISNTLLRVVTEDVELAGALFPEGTMVVATPLRPTVIPRSTTIPSGSDITREGLPPIMSFGGVVHYCVGANLARLRSPRR